MIVIQEKICSGNKCIRKTYPATTEFFGLGTSSYGLHSHCRECRKMYREENKQFIKDSKKKWYKKNKKKILSRSNEYQKTRRKNDPLFVATQRVRNLIGESMRGKKGSKKTEKILGCSFEFFKEYIESLFSDGMNWSNQGGSIKGKWQLHHLMPLHTAEDSEELILLNHYTNFYPLWTEDHKMVHHYLNKCGL